MPTAICAKCGRTRSWRNTRGSRLSDLICCDEPMKAATWTGTDAGYIVRPAPQTAGKFERCALCNRKRVPDKGGVRIKEPTTFTVVRNGEHSQQTVEPGQMVCWFHSTTYPVFLK